MKTSRLFKACKPSRKTVAVIVLLASSLAACGVESEAPRPQRGPSRLMTGEGGELTHALMDMSERPPPWRPGPM
ncbi:hypothetical protein [Noviherbaspirillum galbum]|uniref:Lipoprotein n=1 Tax=Noviherbaspirillum galbum TaxID=2709383 RepID=A0A6B3SNU2_9BURK|nr:hypothetical protein [Noviherbaspirillum galbum]NEX60356.1 hypothetical protein [Noviherbaspirillum galbum]